MIDRNDIKKYINLCDIYNIEQIQYIMNNNDLNYCSEKKILEKFKLFFGNNVNNILSEIHKKYLMFGGKRKKIPRFKKKRFKLTKNSLKKNISQIKTSPRKSYNYTNSYDYSPTSSPFDDLPLARSRNIRYKPPSLYSTRYNPRRSFIKQQNTPNVYYKEHSNCRCWCPSKIHYGGKSTCILQLNLSDRIL